MIRLSDSMGLSAFGLRAGSPDAAPSAESRATATLDGEFLGGTTSIGSDVNAAIRGSTVAQHAQNVLSHMLCSDAS